MGWTVKMTDEYEQWFMNLDDDLQDALIVDIKVLEIIGPKLGRPHVETLKVKKGEKKIKELRTEHEGKPYRSLFVFDPERSAILLLGGNKATDKKWYRRNIPKALDIYKKYLISLNNRRK